ncbi:hypothetical protein DAPK24_031210 [Pichia kluyveri]|uniref:Uncharacterized protein n=1 Tax=Pichia kluyveri TaxID=36015 RepID=A0AAV5R4W3_PICKL|nr:hypothetical protein DAPK24_031210 [Pichia kluyveri]
MDNNSTVMKLYQPDDGKTYLHIVSAYSKNKKLEPRVLLVNDEVTKYFIHFTLALFPLKHDAMKILSLDPSINYPTHILNDVEIDFDESLEHIKNAAHLDNAKDCLNRYVFCVPHSKNNGFCVGRMSENCLKDLLIVGDNREKFKVPSLKQAFVFFKTQIGLQKAYKAFLSHHKIIASEFGHNQITHIENYAVVENVSNIERSRAFHISFNIMRGLNQNLCFTKTHKH